MSLDFEDVLDLKDKVEESFVVEEHEKGADPHPNPAQAVDQTAGSNSEAEVILEDENDSEVELLKTLTAKRKKGFRRGNASCKIVSYSLSCHELS
jgi:hypothetical protein